MKRYFVSLFNYGHLISMFDTTWQQLIVPKNNFELHLNNTKSLNKMLGQIQWWKVKRRPRNYYSVYKCTIERKVLAEIEV